MTLTINYLKDNKIIGRYFNPNHKLQGSYKRVIKKQNGCFNITDFGSVIYNPETNTTIINVIVK